MTNELTTTNPIAAELLEKVVVHGDLSKLTPAERVDYYRRVCESLGLNPLTRPFQYLELDKKLVLYAGRDCTDQLRQSRSISVTIVDRQEAQDLYIVTARATMPDGRTDESIGVVALTKEDGDWHTTPEGRRFWKGTGIWIALRGDALANALMKTETKAKRRVTLSISGLGMIDETEIETLPAARAVHVDEQGQIVKPAPTAPTLNAPNASELAKQAVDAGVVEVGYITGWCHERGVKKIADAPERDRVLLAHDLANRLAAAG